MPSPLLQMQFISNLLSLFLLPAALTKENIRHLLPPLHLIALMFTLKHNMRRGNLRLRARKLISSEWKSTVTIR